MYKSKVARFYMAHSVESFPQKSLTPAEHLLVKIRPPGGHRTGRIFASKLSAGVRFFWGGAIL